MGFLRRLFGTAAADDSEGPDDATTDEAIERAVAHIDPKLRLVAGYRRELRPSVRIALKFAREMAGRIPGPVTLSAGAWSTDPLLRLIFAAPTDIGQRLSRGQELQAYVNKRGAATSEIYVLFAARRDERTVLGAELHGNMVRTDVAQRTVSFAQHQATIPCATEEELRAEMERRAFVFLLNRVLARISGLKSRTQELEQQRAMLSTRLMLLKQRGGGLEDAFGPSENVSDVEVIERKLAENARYLESTKASVGTLDRYLDQARAVLSNPGDFLSLTEVQLRVNSVNQIIAPGAPGSAMEFNLVEVRLAEDPPRQGTVMVGRLPSGEVISRGDMLRDAERFL